MLTSHGIFSRFVGTQYSWIEMFAVPGKSGVTTVLQSESWLIDLLCYVGFSCYVTKAKQKKPSDRVCAACAQKIRIAVTSYAYGFFEIWF